MGSKKRLIGGIGLIGLLVAALLIYLLFFRDNAAETVNSVEADAARQEALAEAAADNAGSEPTSGEPSSPDDDEYDDGEDELDTGQPDSPASVGAATDGVWSIDGSIGTFDDSCLTDVCGSNFVGFRINEELANFGAKTVVGRTDQVTGSMELSGTQLIGAKFVVDMTSLVTDNDGRTSALRGPNGGLETGLFPEAVFELTEVVDLGQLPAEGASITFVANGNLTVHGVTNPVSVSLTAESQAGVIIVFGSLADMALADYDIPKPTAVVVVSVEEIATMELQLFLSR